MSHEEHRSYGQLSTGGGAFLFVDETRICNKLVDKIEVLA